jgi:hypothetical protein
VVVDEYCGVTEGELHALAEKMADPLVALYIKLRESLGSTVKLYIATSDSTVSSKISRSAIKYRKLLMWNLPRSSFEEIVEELKSWAKSLGLCLEELAWSLFGGNVRELLESSNNGLAVWLENLVSVIRRAVEVTMRSRGLTEHDVMEELRGVAERGAEGLGMLKIYDAMPGEDAVIEYYATDFLSELPKEQWVSRYTAFQIPAYYHVLRAIVLEGEVDVGPGRVLEVLVKS